MTKAKHSASDEYSLTCQMQTWPNDLLRQVATGELHAQTIARYEMAARGVDRAGRYVGHAEARKSWGVL